MPIKVCNDLPSAQTLLNEGIFIMPESRALTQDIRPLRIAILNIMPTKQQTEAQLMRLIGNSPLQIEIVFLYPSTYTSKHTSAKYLSTFYKTFDDVCDEKFDGLIITGAPVEGMEFEQVKYWDEFTRILEWGKKNVYATLYICWGAQAGLYYHYGIKKYPLEKKMSGVFAHTIDNPVALTRGFDDIFYVPHSRYTEVRREDIEKNPKLTIITSSRESGVHTVMAKSGRRIFVTGHSEYDPLTLKSEYDRDIKKGLNIDPPKNYFENGDPNLPPIVTWRGHATLFFNNWLNYYVYQETPYDVHSIKSDENV